MNADSVFQSVVGSNPKKRKLDSPTEANKKPKPEPQVNNSAPKFPPIYTPLAPIAAPTCVANLRPFTPIIPQPENTKTEKPKPTKVPHKIAPLPLAASALPPLAPALSVISPTFPQSGLQEHQSIAPAANSTQLASADLSDVESGSDYDSDSGSDNPRDIDYFISDFFLCEPVDLSFGEDWSETDEGDLQIEKRRKKIERLISLYRAQAIRLRDMLETKYQKFLKMQLANANKYSKFAKHRPISKSTTSSVNEFGNYHNLKNVRNAILSTSSQDRLTGNVKGVDSGIEGGENSEQQSELGKPKTCSFAECQEKVLPLSSYCATHILYDKNQVLYVQCSYANPVGGSRCTNPAIKHSTIPPLCTTHKDLVKSVADGDLSGKSSTLNIHQPLAPFGLSLSLSSSTGSSSSMPPSATSTSVPSPSPSLSSSSSSPSLSSLLSAASSPAAGTSSVLSPSSSNILQGLHPLQVPHFQFQLQQQLQQQYQHQQLLQYQQNPQLQKLNTRPGTHPYLANSQSTIPSPTTSTPLDRKSVV